MKRFVKILAIIIVILILAIIIIPFAFKGQIIEVVKNEANKNLNAKVDFSDFGLSLFKSFPNFTLELEDLTVVGIDDFENDTLANIKSLEVSINFLSVIKGESYEVKSISIVQPFVQLLILDDGTANWDIAKGDGAEEEAVAEESEESSPFSLSLRKLRITNARFLYIDLETKTEMYAVGLNHTLSGDLTADHTTLNTNTSISDLTLLSEGVKYLNKANLDFKAGIDADLLNSKYSFRKNELKLNNLFLAFNGYLKMLEKDYELDIDFAASKSDFKNFLSLIPAIYAKDFEGIKTTGKLAFDGFVRGVYTENSLPSFNVNLKVDDASFKYPDLPGSVENINIDVNASNPGGDEDNTLIEIRKLHLEMAENPVDVVMIMKTPVSDPFIDGHVQGVVNLAKVKDVYPLEVDEELSGEFTANVFLKGNMSSIENEKYQDFKAIGSLLLQGMSYQSQDLPKGIEIKNAQLNFSPAYLHLVDFNSSIGESDLAAEGKITNYMAYIFNDEMIKGNFNTRSNYFNMNDLMPENEEEISAEESTDTLQMSVIKVPANIDFYLSSTFGKIIYDEMEMTDVVGAVRIRDEKVILNNLKMKLLDGSMTVNGLYTTANPEMPEVDFDLDIVDFNIQKSFKTFEVMGVLAPVAKHASGTFSTKMDYFAGLDQEMMPVLSTTTGKGNLTTSRLKLENVKALNKIASALKMNQLKDIDLDRVNLSFEFIDGKVYTKPFDIKYKNITGVVFGTTSFEKEIDYDMNLNIPRSEFGQQANDVLNGLVSQAQSKGVNVNLANEVSVDIKIEGTVSDPKVKTGLKEVTKSATEQLKSQLEDELEAKKKELEQKAQEELEKQKKKAEERLRKEQEKAKAEAEKLKKEAEERAKKRSRRT